MDIIKVFGTNLRYYRNKLGVSQEKFGEMCNLHRTYISDIERFNRSISLENIQKLPTLLASKHINFLSKTCQIALRIWRKTNFMVAYDGLNSFFNGTFFLVNIITIEEHLFSMDKI